MPIGQKIKMYYDPRGNVIRTVNPDNSEQWVIHGTPATLSSVEVKNSWSFKNYIPTPWESYTYDANDLATKTNSRSYGYDLTPKSAVVDALGRTVKTVNRLSQNSADEVVMMYNYDIQGNNLEVIDALGRSVFINKFDLNKKVLYTNHIDGGKKYPLADVTGKDIEAKDDKGARVLNSFDAISRPKKLFAKDKTGESFTQRQHITYGDEGGVPDALTNSLLGKPYQHFDEAGLTQVENYDYKGNATKKMRKVISDSEILSVFGGATVDCYRVDWTGLNIGILDTTEYRSNIEYDALNRSTKIVYPESVDSKHKVCIPTYNKAGALQKIELLDDINGTSTTYVNHIAYNAKGQKLLVAWNNDVMMRFVYDKYTFRLKRVKAEKYTYSQTSNEHTYTYNSGTTRYDQKYIYDLVGNVLSVTDKTPDCGLPTANNELQKLFEYDALYRLIYANGREMTNQNDSYLFADAPQIGNPTANDCRYYEQEYEYDKTGNITKLKHRVDHNTSEYYTRIFEYHSGNNKLSKVRNGSNTITYSEFTHDSNGNTIGNNSDRNYEWDYGDKLRSFYISASGSISQYTHYLYDTAGNRVKKITRKNNGALIESTIYIDGGFEHHKKNSEGKNYLQIQGGVEKRIGKFAGDMEDTFDEMDIYHITDYLSSATIRLDDGGSEIDREEHHPYGDTAVRNFTQKRYRFTGKEKDGETGLYYMGARYYASWCCKFLSIDPLAVNYAGQSPYAYANCNPLKFNDPSGMAGEAQTENSASNGSGDNITNYTPETIGSAKPKDGDTYTDKNGNKLYYDGKENIWTLKEVIITGTKSDVTDPIKEAGKDLIKEHAPDVIEKAGDKLIAKSEKNAEALKTSGKLVGTNGKVYDSPGVTKEGVPKNLGNKYFTTKGIDPAKTPQLLGWKNVAGKGLKAVGEVGGEVLSLAEFATSKDKDPFTLLPTSFLTDIASEQWDQVDLEILDVAIAQGYWSTRSYLEGAQRNPRNKSVEGLVLIDVTASVFVSAMNGDFKDINTVYDKTYMSNEPKNFSILVKQVDVGKGQTILKILAGFNIPKKN